MKNPWEEINLKEYEDYMSLESVQQLQTISDLMANQFYWHPAKTVMVLGVSGGNGLEHVSPQMIERVYGVDINASYLKACANRYPHLDGTLELICADLTESRTTLPHVELVIADLLIEYVGLDCFQRLILQIEPQYVSCVIEGAESEQADITCSRLFSRLEQVYRPVQKLPLTELMQKLCYQTVLEQEERLPNGQTLLRLDFKRCSPV